LDPVIPGGSVGAGVGDTWPRVVAAKPAHKNTDAVISEKGILRVRFIILFYGVSPDLVSMSALAAINVSCKLNFSSRSHAVEGVRLSCLGVSGKNNTLCPNPHGQIFKGGKSNGASRKDSGAPTDCEVAEKEGRRSSLVCTSSTAASKIALAFCQLSPSISSAQLAMQPGFRQFPIALDRCGRHAQSFRSFFNR